VIICFNTVVVACESIPGARVTFPLFSCVVVVMFREKTYVKHILSVPLAEDSPVVIVIIKG
jgi:hypothetical protein